MYHKAPALHGGVQSEGGELKLYAALGIARGDIVAFVGAGGKSHAVIQAARELEEDGVKVLVAPTTKMFTSEAEEIGSALISEDEDELRREIAQILTSQGTVVAGSALISKNRIDGIEASWFPALAPKDGVTLVEADGARRRPIKGPAPNEPLLPFGATLVVIVGGVRALGEIVDEEHVHRPEIFSELTGVGLGHTIDARAFALALLAGLRTVPDGARRTALLTDVEPGQSMSRASTVAHQLWRGGVRQVVLSSLPKETPGRVWVL